MKVKTWWLGYIFLCGMGWSTQSWWLVWVRGMHYATEDPHNYWSTSMCVCLWPGEKQSVPFWSECARLSQESLAELCYVKLMPPTSRTSPHITGRFLLHFSSLLFPFFFFCFFFFFFFFFTKMHIFLSLVFLCGSRVCLKGGSFRQNKWSIVMGREKGSFIKGIMPGYHLILLNINSMSPSGLKKSAKITFHVAALRLKYANIRVNQL